MSSSLGKHGSSAGPLQEEWAVRERLALASSVVRSGDQNWASVSRAVKPVLESGCCAKMRPPEFYSQKNCASHYSEMLEKVGTQKRKRTLSEGGGTETPGEQIVRKLTFDRIDELKKSIKSDHALYKQLKADVEKIKSGRYDNKIHSIWAELQGRKKAAEDAGAVFKTLYESSGNKAPLQLPPPGKQMRPSPGSQMLSLSPQKQAKHQRLHKPTAKFQKFQQQQQQKYGHSINLQPHPPNDEGGEIIDASDDEQTMGDSASSTPKQNLQPQGLYGEAMDIDDKDESLQSMTTDSGHDQQSFQSKQESPSTQTSLLSSLLSAPTKLAQQVIIDREKMDKKDDGSSQKSGTSLLNSSGGFSANSQQNAEKSFLGHTPSSGEVKIPESVQAPPAQTGGGVTKPGLVDVTSMSGASTAPLLSKLLTNSSSNRHSTQHDSLVKGLQTGHKITVNSGTPISVDGDGGGSVIANSVMSIDPKAALTAMIPSPVVMTPPAESKEITNETVKTDAESSAEQNNLSSVNAVSMIQDDEVVVIGENKLEEGLPTSRTFKTRAAKPGRPGRPSKGGRKTPRNRKQSSASTDQECEEDKEEDVESERGSSERGEEEDDETLDRNKDQEIDDLNDEGNNTPDERRDDVLGVMSGTDSLPASPASQISLSSTDDPDAMQARKTWKKSIMLVWRAAANHKYANVFLHAVTDDEAPGYSNIVYRPMNLTTVKKNIENGSINSTSEFQRDMMLMFQNALMYNSIEHDVYHMAEEMRDDVMEQIQSYIATQLMVQSDRDAKTLRGHRNDATRRPKL